MADRPILFSGPMVRALLAGTKTQTRRVLKGSALAAREPQWEAKKGDDGVWRIVADTPEVSGRVVPDIRIAVGDRLWVKETWRPFSIDMSPWDLEVLYAADGESRIIKDGEFGEKDWNFPKAAARGNVSSLFMTRWASRLTLSVTDVRVERLQDCSEDDAFAEGIETDVWDQAPAARNYGEEDAWFVGWPMGILPPSVSVEPDEVCRRSYSTLWDKINGTGAWASNPWVAAYTFTVERGNIDQLGTAA